MNPSDLQTIVFEKVRVPPIKTQGIKTRLVQWIAERASSSLAARWIEPFLGSGVVGFNLAPRQAVFADVNPHLIAFYRGLQQGEFSPADVRTHLEREGEQLAEIGGEHYYAVRERFNERPSSLDFLFLNRCCFNGVVRFNRRGRFNVPFGKKPLRFSKAYVTKIVNQVDWLHRRMAESEWTFLHQSFEQTLGQAGAEDFVYCDPPYIGRHVDYYSSWDEASEATLQRLLTVSGCDFVLSTWEGNAHRQNPFSDKYWSGFDRAKREHFYHVGAFEKNRRPITEVLVFRIAEKG